MASVIQTITAKARIASIRWPATGNPAGVGSRITAIIATTPANKPQLILAAFFAIAVGFARSIDCCDADMESSDQNRPFDTLLGGPAKHCGRSISIEEVCEDMQDYNPACSLLTCAAAQPHKPNDGCTDPEAEKSPSEFGRAFAATYQGDAAPVFAASDDVFFLWCARRYRYFPRSMGEGKSYAFACGACRRRRLARVAMDHQNGVWRARRYRRDFRFAPESLCHARRRLNRVRAPDSGGGSGACSRHSLCERTFCHRNDADCDRDRSARRCRGCHVYRGCGKGGRTRELAIRNRRRNRIGDGTGTRQAFAFDRHSCRGWPFRLSG